MIVKEKIGGQFFELIQGDCLIENEHIQDGSVDLILTDLPYGTMQPNHNGKAYRAMYKDKLSWDFSIDPNKIHEVAARILRPNGKMILFCQEPYTSELMGSRIAQLPFSLKMIWEKNTFGSHLKCNIAPLGYFEEILVFSKISGAIAPHDYELKHPQRDYFKKILDYIGLNKKDIIRKIGQRADHCFRVNSTQYSLCTQPTYCDLIYKYRIDLMEGFVRWKYLKEEDDAFKESNKQERDAYLVEYNKQYPSNFNLWEGNKYKSNILKYNKETNRHHPTQKPVLLLEDLIKTFSNENDLVVDLTMGSGSTGVAAKNTNRSFIGIEKDDNYFNIAVNRIKGTKPNPNNFEKVEERGFFSFTDEPTKAD